MQLPLDAPRIDLTVVLSLLEAVALTQMIPVVSLACIQQSLPRQQGIV